MPTKLRFNQLRINFSRFQGSAKKNGIKFRHKSSFFHKTQITTLVFRARILTVGLGQFFKISTLFDLLEQVSRFLFGLRIGRIKHLLNLRISALFLKFEQGGFFDLIFGLFNVFHAWNFHNHAIIIAGAGSFGLHQRLANPKSVDSFFNHVLGALQSVSPFGSFHF